MGGIQAKPKEEVRLWQVSGRKPSFVNGDFWAAQQAKLEPFKVQGKGRTLSLREAQDRVRELGLRVVPRSFVPTYTANGSFREGRFKPEFPHTGTMGKVPVAFYHNYNRMDYMDHPFRVMFTVGDDEKSTMVEWNLIEDARAEGDGHRGPELTTIMKMKLAYRSEPLGFGLKGDKEEATSSNLSDPKGTHSKPQPKGEWGRALLDERVYLRDLKESKVVRRQKMQVKAQDREERRTKRMSAGRERREEKKLEHDRRVEERNYLTWRLEQVAARKERRKVNKAKMEVKAENMGRNDVTSPTLDSSAEVKLYIALL